MRSGSYRDAVLIDIAIGVTAGVVAAGAMHAFQLAWSKAVKKPEGTPATAEAADALSQAMRDRDVSEEHRQMASNGVHYVTGGILGGVYGLMAGLQPLVTAGSGLLFGGTWLLGDELAVPALRLGPPPSDVKADAHVYGALSHAVFAFTLDLVRRHLNENIAKRRQSKGSRLWLS